MEIAGLAIVKNEADIIEAFVRHNLRFLDRLIVIDNISSDSTPAILESLVAEGLPLMLERDASTNHPQVDALNRRLQALKSDSPDFVVMLDADEFINCPTRDAFLGELTGIPDGACGLLGWAFYVPTPDDDQDEPNPLRRIRCCARRTTTRYKAVIPKSLLCGRDFALKPGNHRCVAATPPEIEHQVLQRCSLAHYPVRSVEQFMSKVIVGEWALASRNNRKAIEGLHWRELHDRVMGGQKPTARDLQLIASNYSFEGPAGECVLEESVVQPPPDFALKYTSMIRLDAVHNALEYADIHFKRLATTALSNGEIAVGKTPFGLMAYHEGDTVIGRSIKLYGEWAAREVLFLRQFVAPGDWVVDVGANIGTHTIPLSESVGPTGKVFAFEPQRISYQLLCANAALNNRYNIHAQNMGLGREEATVHIPLHTQGNMGKLGIDNWGQGEPVTIVPLDAWEFPRIRLIKIDVEGMERDVIDGARETIGEHKPVIFVENNTRAKSAALIRTLFDLGYRCWWFFDPYYNPKNFYGNPENIFATVGRPEINMACLHRDQGLELKGLVEVRGPDHDWQDALRECLR